MPCQIFDKAFNLNGKIYSIFSISIISINSSIRKILFSFKLASPWIQVAQQTALNSSIPLEISPVIIPDNTSPEPAILKFLLECVLITTSPVGEAIIVSCPFNTIIDLLFSEAFLTEPILSFSL